jgi:LysM repeat protein
MGNKFSKYLIVSMFLMLSVITLQAQYTNSDIEAYILKYKELAIGKMYEYQIPASITLAQGIFESGAGTSRLATEGNNHFGIKCHKEWTGDSILVDDDKAAECFRKYSKVEDSYDDHSLFLKTRDRYAKLFTLNVTDYEAWAKELKAAGYATNPKYPDNLISLIKRFHLNRYDSVYLERLNSGFFDENWKEKITQQENVELATNVVKRRNPDGSSLILFFFAKELIPKKAEYPFSDREVYENNKVLYIIAKEGDTYENIAAEVQESEKNLRKYNDEIKLREPIAGEVIYIEKKMKNNPLSIYKVQKGETARYLSQKFAISLQDLLKYNHLDKETTRLKEGQMIRLKK